MRTISDILNNKAVANVFFNLYERWLDEGKYEDINDYARFIHRTLGCEGFQTVLIGGTKRPFGIKVRYEGMNVSIFVKRKGNNIVLCATACPEPVAEPSVKAVIKPDNEGSYRIPWVYAHGKLEDDLHTGDLFCTDLNGEVVENGMRATYNGKLVVFHLYRNRFGQLTGVATYADDEEACAYGRNLVATKPDMF